jgi:hypothetical protein
VAVVVLGTITDTVADEAVPEDDDRGDDALANLRAENADSDAAPRWPKPSPPNGPTRWLTRDSPSGP